MSLSLPCPPPPPPKHTQGHACCCHSVTVSIHRYVWRGRPAMQDACMLLQFLMGYTTHDISWISAQLHPCNPTPVAGNRLGCSFHYMHYTHYTQVSQPFPAPRGQTRCGTQHATVAACSGCCERQLGLSMRVLTAQGSLVDVNSP